MIPAPKMLDEAAHPVIAFCRCNHYVWTESEKTRKVTAPYSRRSISRAIRGRWPVVRLAAPATSMSRQTEMIGPVMNRPLIEGNFSNFVVVVAPPPCRLDGGVHLQTPSAAGKHRNTRPPKKEKKALFREELRIFLRSRHGSCHQSQTSRRVIAAHCHVWARSGDLLLASRQSTAPGRRFPNL
jgi:hypothetical protein